MKKLAYVFVSLFCSLAFVVSTASATDFNSTRASSTKRCVLPIKDDFTRNNVRFQDEASLIITIHVNEATGVITSSDAYLNVSWVTVTHPTTAYSGSITNINVTRKLSSTRRTVTATATYDILGSTPFNVGNVSYHVTGHSLSCS